jgi:hypothetical protein
MMVKPSDFRNLKGLYFLVILAPSNPMNNEKTYQQLSKTYGYACF